MSKQITDSAKKASPNNLNRQIGLYSLAAAVAGVSMLALAEPSLAEVVVTKKTIPIPMSPIGSPELVKVSMANDGNENFSFWLYSDPAISDRGFQLAAAGPHEGIMVGGDFYPEALALARGANIGPSVNSFFSLSGSGALIEATGTSRSGRSARGFWGGNPKNKYIGVRFQIDGQTHYGWIRVTVTTNLSVNGPLLSGTITGYAYETVANKAIKAGTAAIAAAEVHVPQSQSGPSLGMLAAGAEGMPMWRRELAASSK